MKKRWIAILAAMVMLFGLLAACAPDAPVADAPAADAPAADAPADDAPAAEAPADDAPAAEAPAGDDSHLMVVIPQMHTTLDPTLANEVPGARMHYLIFQTLVYQDENGNIIPGLATEWEFVDAQTVVFTIREGILFHDGSVLTAEDVAFSLTRAGNSSHVAAITDMIDEAVALSDNQVELRTLFPFAPILNHLAHTATSIVSRAVVESIGDDEHGMNPVGTGPFRFHNEVAGDRLELVRFEEFNSVSPGLPEGQLPALERITFRVVPEGSVRTIELETGSAHVQFDVTTTDVQRIRDHADLTMHEVPSLAINTWLGFNNQMPPFDDIRVRQAIAYAIDIEAIVEVAWAGIGFVAPGPLPNTVRGYVDFPIIPVNIERARELMAEAGLEDGFETSIWLNEGNAMRADAASMIQAQLRALNIETSVNIYEWATLLPATAAGEHDMSLMGWVTVTGDPDYGLYPVYHTDNHGDAGNRNFFSHPRVDELLDLGRTSTDDAERMEIYREAQELIMQELPLIPLWQSAELHASTPNVHGFTITPNSLMPLWNVSIR